MLTDVWNAAGMAGIFRMIPVADPATAPNAAVEGLQVISFYHRTLF